MMLRLSGDLRDVEVTVAGDDSVVGLKEKIAEVANIPTDLQSLYLDSGWCTADSYRPLVAQLALEYQLEATA